MERFLLSDWVVEKRSDGWYFSTYQDRHNKRSYKGPYSSAHSVCLMVARQLRREIEARAQPKAA